MQCVNMRLTAEAEVTAEWDECCCVCSAGCLQVLGEFVSPSPPRLLHRLPPVSRGTVGLFPLLDLLQHPEVLLVAGES